MICVVLVVCGDLVLVGIGGGGYIGLMLCWLDVVAVIGYVVTCTLNALVVGVIVVLICVYR